MSHNGFVNGLNGAWFDPAVPSGQDLKTLDTNITKAINGDGGGTWSPGTVLTIGGAGRWFAGPTPLAGSSIVLTPTGSGLRITLGDSDEILLNVGHSGRLRTIHTPCLAASFSPVAYWIPNLTFYGLQSTLTGSRFVLPLRVHHGGTIGTVTFNFRPGASHIGVPARLPAFRVYQVDALGNVTPLQTGTSVDANGFQLYLPVPASAAVWNAAGAISLNYTCNPTVIDTTQYAYYAEVVDESGVNALPGNVYQSVTANFNTIADLRPQ
jgi:hypothetical protein